MIPRRLRPKLAEPELYLAQHADELVILDEIQRTRQLFRSLCEELAAT